MANPEHMAIFKSGSKAWNDWRKNNSDVKPDLSHSQIDGTLSEMDFSNTDFNKCIICPTDVKNAIFRGANFNSADLQHSGHIIWDVDFTGATFLHANLDFMQFVGAILHNSNLSWARVWQGRFSNALLEKARFIHARLDEVSFNGANLKEACFDHASLRSAWVTGAKDLTGVHFGRADLFDANFDGCSLKKAIFGEARLEGTSFIKADLTEASFCDANLSGANFTEAILIKAHFDGAILRDAKLDRAKLNEAILFHANLSGASTDEADFSNANCLDTIFANVNLSNVKGLETCRHNGPSTINHQTFQQSVSLPLEFLRGCGLSDWEIESIKLHDPHLGSEKITQLLYKIHDLRVSQVILSGSLFISYSRQDKLFVEKLGQRFNQHGIRFWQDIHDATAGPLEAQVDRAIRHNPILLLILSEASTQSDWVEHEARTARKLEKETGRHVLCPIALDQAWKTSAWPERLREQIENYNILDFSAWLEEDEFSRSMGKLIAGLDTYYRPSI